MHKLHLDDVSRSLTMQVSPNDEYCIKCGGILRHRDLQAVTYGILERLLNLYSHLTWAERQPFAIKETRSNRNGHKINYEKYFKCEF